MEKKGNNLFDEKEVRRTLKLTHKKGHIIEMRVLDTPKGILSGYYDNPDDVIRDIEKHISSASGIYTTMNQINPALLARAKNRLRVVKSGDTTPDNEVIRRRSVLIDADAVRPAKISATDEEHELALRKSDTVEAFLKEEGFPDPLAADSGNGGHLRYAADLPNTPESTRLIERFIKALDYKFSDERVKIDTANSNASRICRLYGTLARKGDNVPERPHRKSLIRRAPSKLEAAPRDLFERVASMCPEDPEPEYKSWSGYSSFDLDKWMEAHSLTVKRTKSWQNGTVYELTECPFNPEHTDGEAAIIKRPDGLGFKCWHNSCQGMGWHTLRDKVDPGWRERKSGNGYGGNARAGTPEEEYSAKPDSQIIKSEAFPFDILSAVVREIITVISESIGVEQEVTAGIMLGLISGAIGNSVRVRLKPGYDVPLFLWMLIVAESGYGRSPTLRALGRPIKEWQSARQTVYDNALKDYRRILRASKNDPDIEIPDEPQMEDYFLSDTTVEALARAFAATPRGIVLYQDELSGLIFGLNQYKGGKGNDRQHYLELWDCDSWNIARKGEKRYIRNTGAALIGGIQPIIMPRVFAQDSFDDGLLPRFLFINAENKPSGFSKRGIDEKYLNQWSNILHSCYNIPAPINDKGYVEYKIIKVSEGGVGVWERFHHEMWQLYPFLSERAKVFIPKLLHYGLKLAGVLHILKSLDKVSEVSEVSVSLEKETVEQAVSLTRYFCGQSIKVLDIYKPKEAQLTEYERRLIICLYKLRTSVKNGRLLFAAIVETYNTGLPEQLVQTSKGIGALLAKLKLITRAFEHNIAYLVWEQDKLSRIFSKVGLITHDTENKNPREDANHANHANHSEDCGCAACIPPENKNTADNVNFDNYSNSDMLESPLGDAYEPPEYAPDTASPPPQESSNKKTAGFIKFTGVKS